MAKTGPKRLTAAQLQARGARPDRVRQRAAEEGRGVLSLLPAGGRTAAVSECPPVLTAVEAQTLYRHVQERYTLDPVGELTLVQCCLALQRAAQCGTAIDKDGLVDHNGAKATAHPLLSAERDARALYLRLLDRLGLLD